MKRSLVIRFDYLVEFYDELPHNSSSLMNLMENLFRSELQTEIFEFLVKSNCE
jgi:hypothetical protein